MSPAPLAKPSLRLYRPRQFDDLQRFGARHDGGYVVPASALKACRTLLSLGVEADWSFEQSALDQVPGLTVVCVDGTTGPEVIQARYERELWRAVKRLRPYKFAEAWALRGKAKAFEEFFARHTFLKLMVAASSGPGRTSLADLLARPAMQAPLFLKMDIEGSEYEVLTAAAADMTRFAVIAIEFHQLDARWADFERAMALLLRTHHVAHVHGNNYDRHVPGTLVPKTLEITFVHHGLAPAQPGASTRSYPVPGLDSPNKRHRAEIPLSFD